MKLEKYINTNINKDRVKELEKIFPEVITDGEIDFDKFKEFFSADILEENSKFGIEWFGKKRAEWNAKTPSKATLRPCVEESKDWDKTKNLYIEGDNLEVLKLLQKSYSSKVDVIYIDPPYNTGNDFVYNDDFKDSLEEYKKYTNQVSEENKCYSTNVEGTGRYHSNWLSMMYPRLKLARNLLKEDGVIFISIDDNEQARLKLLCDEIFGENNFITNFVWQKTTGANDSKFLKETNEYILCYAKDKNFLLFSKIYLDVENDIKYKMKDEHFNKRGKYKLNNLARASHSYSKSLDYPIEMNGKKYYPDNSYDNYIKRHGGSHATKDWQWMWSSSKVLWGIENGFIVIDRDTIKHKVYQFVDNNDQLVEKTSLYTNIIKVDEISNLMGTAELKKYFDNFKVFDHPKPTKLIKFIINLHTNKSSIILDFFSGSSSTAHGVINLNLEDKGSRNFIMVQIPEKVDDNKDFKNICEIGKERIRRAGELILKENNESKEPKDLSKLDIGFRVLKLDTSNIKEFEFDENSNQSSLFDENIIKDRTPMDLLFETIIKLGLSFDKDISEYKFKDNKINIFNNGELITCFDKNIDIDVIDEIIKIKDKLKPEIWRVVFLDNGFESDKTKINAREKIRSSLENEEWLDIEKVFNTI